MPLNEAPPHETFLRTSLGARGTTLVTAAVSHKLPPDLLLMNEAWSYERNSCKSPIVSIIYKAIRRMSGLQNAIILSYAT